MNTKDLIEIIERFGLQEEELDQVVNFANEMYNNGGIFARCGSCRHWRTQNCAFPNTKLNYLTCINYELKKKEVKE